MILIIGLLSRDLGATTVTYRTQLSPAVQDRALRAALEASSNLIALHGAAEPPSARGLVRRARRDREQLWTVLRSFGFYAGEVRITIAGLSLDVAELIERIEAMTGDYPLLVVIGIEPGPRFTIGRFEVRNAATGEADLGAEVDPSALGVHPGDPAEANTVIAAELRLIDELRAAGHPFAAVPERRVIVDHATREMTVTLSVDPGPRAKLGAVTVDGLETVDERFVLEHLDLGSGAVYSPDALRRMRERLGGLEVFSAIRIQTAEFLDANGQLPVFIGVTERPRRIVGLGAELSTSEGFGANAFWANRNLFGRAQSLRLQAEVGRIGRSTPDEIDYGGGLRYRAPDFLAREQELVAVLAAGRENPEAFRRDAVEAAVGIERRLQERLKVSAGIQAEVSDVEGLGPSGRHLFVSLPLGVQLDTSDDPLDPTRGARIALEVTPYIGDQNLTRASLAGAGYFRPPHARGSVLALRARLGSILGAELPEVPADKRFYAGGGGSVRGYSFQSIGPKTPSGDPVGGLSLLEIGAELRVRLAEALGLVPFIEGGQVFDDALSNFSDPLQFGAGLGFRYFTAIGPLRLDIAFPVNKRRGDDDFQLYLSIGQAF